VNDLDSSLMQAAIWNCHKWKICPTGPTTPGELGIYPFKELFTEQTFKDAYTKCRSDGTDYC
tara:strand:+ start:236 stop:421 length:186 start_codon:yes stop_codon:yes gene_type:complete